MRYRLMRVAGVGAEMMIRSMDAELFPGDDRPDTKVGHWWILARGHECAGYAGLVPSMQWRGAGYLVRAGVLPRHQGRGLQKRLIRVRVAHARRLGWQWVVTDTTNNPASANSLIACGFRMYLPSQPWGFKTTCYWRRRTGSN